MIRGTTAQFKFKLPYTKAELEWVTIKFWQPNNPNKFLPITKDKSMCGGDPDSKEIYVSLTAEETSRFSDKYKAKAQLRALHSASGTVFGSRTQLITVYPMSDDILEENPMLPTEIKEDWVIFDAGTVST